MKAKVSKFGWLIFVGLFALAICSCHDGDDSKDAEDDEASSSSMEMEEEEDADGEESDAPRAPRAVLRVGGNWTGSFFNTSEAGSVGLKARIVQVNDSIVITTDKPTPPGQSFSGSIDEDGDMRLTDSFDGETWTTYFGPVTGSSIKIADFVLEGTTTITTTNGVSASPPLNVVELRR